MTTARLAAARALVAVERGRTTLSAEMERARTDLPEARDRALLFEITAGTLRWRNEIDAVLARHSRRPLADLSPEVRSVLRSGAYQLLHLDRVPSHAAVSEAVEVIRALGQPRAAGFVNAVLRRLGNRGVLRILPTRPPDESDLAGAVRYLSVTLSHPEWLVRRWIARAGFEATERWCRFNNAPPSVIVRPLHSGQMPDLERALAAAGVDAVLARFARGAFEIAPGSLGRLPAPLLDSLIVQDEGSQLVGQAVSAQPGERVLDVCAAPGGKTMLIAASVGATGDVVAADYRRPRVALLRSQLRRAGVLAHVLALDARTPLPFSDVFDRVLLDAPCSGLGTVRRDPDLKWSRLETDLQDLASAQLAMIANAARAVRPGGTLIYATCSSEPEENIEIVSAFLERTPEFRLAPVVLAGAEALVSEAGYLETLPYRDNLDAYFAAALVRSQAA